VADTIRLVRPDDLFVGTVQLENLVIAPDGAAPVRVVASEPAAVIVRLPPQHYLEPAIHERNADIVRRHLGRRRSRVPHIRPEPRVLGHAERGAWSA